MAGPSSRSLARLVRAGLLLALAACAATKPPPPAEPPVDDDSAVLIPTDQLAVPPFMVLQRVRGKYGTQDVAFECVVQLSHGKLTVTGITPYTARAFVIEQDGIAVHSEAFMLRDVWFEPLQVLYDVHRTFFRGLPAAQTNGAHEQLDHGEFVRELWDRGHIVERRFHALETSASLIVISFEGAPAPLIAPRMRLYNLHYSYWLEIENVQQKRLDEGFSLAVEKEPAR
jgi:hypothetical protein